MEPEEYAQMYEVESSHWYFKAKRLILEQMLKRFLSVNKKYRILDVGCGTGKILQMLSQFGEIYGIDSSPIAVNLCQKRGLTNLFTVDLEGKFPFRNNYFDVVCAFDLFEHLENEGKILSEILRIVKPDAYLFVTVPAFMFLWSGHDIALHHYRRYTKKQLRSVLESNGFKVFKTSYYNFFLFSVAFLYRFFKRLFRRPDKSPKSEFFVRIPEWLNAIFLNIFTLEGLILKYMNFPIGVSLLCIAKTRSKVLNNK